jgi:two-component system NtrC family sensor kinase
MSCTNEMTVSRKGAKSRMHDRKLRSTGTKAKTRVDRTRQPGTDLECLLTQAQRELSEALERQAATDEVLKVISSSPSDVQPVFDAIAHSAMRLFGGQSATVTRVVDDMIHLAALTAGNQAGIELVRGSFPAPLSSSGIHSRVARSGEPAFRFDIETEPDVSSEMRELARARGYRSILVVPMLREGVAIGTVAVTRRDPGRFTDSQIDLLRTFAAQAVIAIENTRLFNEIQDKSKQLAEASERNHSFSPA